MSFLKSRKFWYAVSTAILAGLKNAFPFIPLPDVQDVVLLGTALIGGHAITDAASAHAKK